MFQLQLFLIHCDEWDRFVDPPRHNIVTGATLLQLALPNLGSNKRSIILEASTLTIAPPMLFMVV